MRYSRLFQEYSGERVKIVMTDGEIFEGELNGYISAADNDPEPESIIVDNIELYTNEIETVEVQK